MYWGGLCVMSSISSQQLTFYSCTVHDRTNRLAIASFDKKKSLKEEGDADILLLYRFIPSQYPVNTTVLYNSFYTGAKTLLAEGTTMAGSANASAWPASVGG